MPIYDTIQTLSPRQIPPISKVLIFIKKHFLLDFIQMSIGTGKISIDLTLQPRGTQTQRIDEKLGKTIHDDLQKLYPFAKITVRVIPK